MPTHASLRFRQVHLDFHTSPAIPGVGARFDKAQFQAELKRGHVDCIRDLLEGASWLVPPSHDRGADAPSLSFDLLDAQVAACRELDVNHRSTSPRASTTLRRPSIRMAPYRARRQVRGLGEIAGRAGFHQMCFNTPYLDYLCAQIREVVERYPRCHGIFLDIISEGEGAAASGAWTGWRRTASTPRSRRGQEKAAAHTIRRYYEQTTAAATSVNPDMPIFHNSGHIPAGRRILLKHFSHLELESLPTGGWGYDHYPMSAKYVATLGMDFLGMTGKFHTSWGNSGGFKHP